MENYYYNHLNKQQQSTYTAIRNGLQQQNRSFQVPRLEGKELSEVYFLLRLDHPELFYSASYRYRYYPESSQAELIPDYLFEKSKILEHQKAMKARVEKLARPAEKLGQMEKLLYIHEFICRNVHYDKLKKQYSHEIIGPLGQGVGVCEGIAKAVKILCDTLGIWCIIALSEANPEKGIKYRHAWNVVQIEKKYYHLDATFDNTLGKQEQLRFDYFLLSDRQIFRDHQPVIWKIPVCSAEDHVYYVEKKLSFTKLEDVAKRAAQAAKKGKTLTFHWRGGYLTREVLSELCKILEEEAVKRGKHAGISLNWPQAVLQSTFEERDSAETVTMEEALLYEAEE